RRWQRVLPGKGDHRGPGRRRHGCGGGCRMQRRQAAELQQAQREQSATNCEWAIHGAEPTRTDYGARRTRNPGGSPMRAIVLCECMKARARTSSLAETALLVLSVVAAACS